MRTADPTYSVSEKASRQAISLLYSNVVTAVIANTILGSMVALVFCDAHLRDNYQIWLGIMIALQAGRTIDLLYWKLRLNGTQYSISLSKWRLSVGAYSTALLWAGQGVYFMNEMSISEFAANTIVLLTMAAAVSSTLAGSISICVIYALIMVVPFSLKAMFSPNELFNLFGYLGVLFSIVIGGACYKSSKYTRNAIYMQNKNQQLLWQQDTLMREMQEKNEEITFINQELEQTVQERTEEIRALSNIDSLTGLSNRDIFTETLEKKLEYAKQQKQQLTLLFIDLDGFKTINDTHGHFTGDFVLSTAAKRLLKIVGQNKDVCRWGGDEFVAVFYNTDLNEAKTIATLIIEAITIPISIENRHLEIGATIGLSNYPHHASDATSLIKMADNAMYLQKAKEKCQARIYNAKESEQQTLSVVK